MAQTPGSIPPWLTSHLPHVPSMTMNNPSMFGDLTKMDPHRNNITSVRTGYKELIFSDLYDKQTVNNFENFNQSNVPQLEDDMDMNNDRQVPTNCPCLAAARENDVKPRSGHAPVYSEPQKELVPDEESEADVGLPSFKVHGRPSAQNTDIKRKHVEQVVPSSSECSRGASNCPIYTSTRRYHEDTDLSENNEMEESDETIKATPSKGSKRKRKAEVHSLGERRRRDKINKKMQALQELLPNCKKVDNASMLDEAIEYLKTLQLQVQMMMSRGRSGFYMPQMMLPASTAPSFGGYAAMCAGMQMNLAYNPAAQFPSITSLVSGMNQPRVNMFGLPGMNQPRVNMFGLPGMNHPRVNMFGLPGMNHPRVNMFGLPGMNHPTVNMFGLPGMNQPRVNMFGQMLLMSMLPSTPPFVSLPQLVRTPAVSQAASIAAAGFTQATYQ